jgi:hypothetical protein
MSLLTDLLSIPGLSPIGARVDIVMDGKTVLVGEWDRNGGLTFTAPSAPFPQPPELVPARRRSARIIEARAMQRNIARDTRDLENIAREARDLERLLAERRAREEVWEDIRRRFFNRELSVPWDRWLLTAEDRARENGLSMEYVPIKGIPRIVHAKGRFQARGGQRFDYVFPELLVDPTLPPVVFPSVEMLAEGEPSFAPGLYIQRHSGVLSKAEVLFEFGC